MAPYTQLLEITNRQSPSFQRKQRERENVQITAFYQEWLESFRVNDPQLLHTDLFLEATAFHTSSCHDHEALKILF